MSYLELNDFNILVGNKIGSIINYGNEFSCFYEIAITTVEKVPGVYVQCQYILGSKN